jgi:hypothetical protein
MPNSQAATTKAPILGCPSLLGYRVSPGLGMLGGVGPPGFAHGSLVLRADPAPVLVKQRHHQRPSQTRDLTARKVISNLSVGQTCERAARIKGRRLLV